MKAAAFDVGTNSVKCIIGELDESNNIRTLYQASRNVRLGEGVDANGVLSDEAMRRTCDAIGEFISRARDEGVQCVRLVGTSALRDAANSDVFQEMIEKEHWAVLEIIDEDEEARLSYQSVVLDPVLGSGFHGPQLVFDIGGGSTELTYGIGNIIVKGVSLKMGAVRITERFIKEPVSSTDIVSAENEINRMLHNNGAVPGSEPRRIVGLGGSIVNLARVCYEVPTGDTPAVHAKKLTLNDVKRSIKTLGNTSLEARKVLTGMEPERADTVIAGALIVGSILKISGIQEVMVSAKGLRHGLLYELLRGHNDDQ